MAKRESNGQDAALDQAEALSRFVTSIKSTIG